MSTPGGEEAIERLKVKLVLVDSLQESSESLSSLNFSFYLQVLSDGGKKKPQLLLFHLAVQT